jgi:hypothetical protein
VRVSSVCFEALANAKGKKFTRSPARVAIEVEIVDTSYFDRLNRYRELVAGWYLFDMTAELRALQKLCCPP